MKPASYHCPRANRPTHRANRRRGIKTHPLPADTAAHWNPASLLHPVDLWVYIDVNGTATRAKRDTLLERRDDDRVYITPTGKTIRGKFKWMYV